MSVSTRAFSFPERLRLWGHRGRRWLRSALRDPQEIVSILGLAALVAFTVYQVHGFWSNGIDDAYITYRYADNLRAGKGLVFNPGERVEGNSSFLFTIMLALVMAFGGEPHFWARVLGGASFCALVIVTYALGRRLFSGPGRRTLSLGAASLVAAATPLAYYSTSGLETDLFAFLLMGAVALQIKRTRGWAFSWGLVAWARPEGMAFAALCIGLEWVCELVEERSLVRASRRAGGHALRFLAVFGPLLIFRVAYYGDLLPNSVIAKGGFLEAHRGASFTAWVNYLWTGHGAMVFRRFIAVWGPVLLLAPVGIVLAGRRRASVLLGGIVAGSYGLCVWDEGDWMGRYRLLTPAIAPLAVLLVSGLRSLLIAPGPVWRRLSWRGRHAVSILLSLAVVAWSFDRLYYERHYRDPYAGNDYLTPIGKNFGAVMQPTDTLSTDMVGVVGYHSRMRMIDQMGLCDRHIARNGVRFPAMGKTDHEYVAGLRPTFYMFHGVGHMRVYYNQLKAFASQRQDYLVIMTPHARRARDPGHRILTVRKDRPDLERVRQVFEAELVDPLAFLGSW
jgi:arabinofuranosyltransferase